MKRLIGNNYLLTLLLSVGALFITSSNIFAQNGAPKLAPEKFQKEANKKKKNVILDIRTPEEVTEGHIEGANFINFLDESFEEELAKLDKKKTYYVYCRSAKRTIPATEKMKEMGFKKIYMLDGGLNNWLESSMEIIKPN